MFFIHECNIFWLFYWTVLNFSCKSEHLSHQHLYRSFFTEILLCFFSSIDKSGVWRQRGIKLYVWAGGRVSFPPCCNYRDVESLLAGKRRAIHRSLISVNPEPEHLTASLQWSAGALPDPLSHALHTHTPLSPLSDFKANQLNMGGTSLYVCKKCSYISLK